MKKNRLKEVLASGGIPVGHMIWEFGTRGIARMLANVDLDFVVVDMEHTAINPPQVADLMAWFQATEIAPFVRVPEAQYSYISRTMDAGALGVMVPNVETVEAAQQAVNAVKFAPLGKRGVGLGGAHTGYLGPDPLDYFEEANENTTVICQIESTTGVENVDAIAALDGVDCVWVGHFDLTQSMGIPGQFDDPRFLEALDRVVAAARKHGKSAGIQPSNLAAAERWIDIGFNVISWKTDIALYSGALRKEIGDLRTRTRN